MVEIQECIYLIMLCRLICTTKKCSQLKWSHLRTELYLLHSIKARFCALSEFWFLAHFPMKGLIVEHRGFCSLLWMGFRSTQWTSLDCHCFHIHALELDFMIHSRSIRAKKPRNNLLPAHADWPSSLLFPRGYLYLQIVTIARADQEFSINFLIIINCCKSCFQNLDFFIFFFSPGILHY